jgi:hypothetical protein
LRRAYDYWQNQPGCYRCPSANKRGQGGSRFLVLYLVLVTGARTKLCTPRFCILRRPVPSHTSCCGFVSPNLLLLINLRVAHVGVDYFINWRSEADLTFVPRQSAAQKRKIARDGASPVDNPLGEPPALLLRINHTASSVKICSCGPAPSPQIETFVTQRETANQHTRPPQE